MGPPVGQFLPLVTFQALMGTLGRIVGSMKSKSSKQISPTKTCLITCPINGFTLVEIIITMAIGAILLSIAVPSFQTSIQNNRKTTAINDLRTALALARSTAVTRRVQVTVCRSNNGANCQTGAGSDWSDGWMIFTNPNNVPATAGLDGDAGEELLRVHGALQGNATLIGLGPVTNRVSFQPRGILNSGFGGTITYCDSRGAINASALVISFSGQVRHAVDDGGDGIVDTNGTNGTNVSC